MWDPTYFYYTAPEPHPPLTPCHRARGGVHPCTTRAKSDGQCGQAQHRRREIAAAALPQRGHDGRDCPTSDGPASDSPTRDSLRSRGARNQRLPNILMTQVKPATNRPLSTAETPGHRSHSRMGPAACTVWRRAASRQRGVRGHPKQMDFLIAVRYCRGTGTPHPFLPVPSGSGQTCPSLPPPLLVCRTRLTNCWERGESCCAPRSPSLSVPLVCACGRGRGGMRFAWAVIASHAPLRGALR